VVPRPPPQILSHVCKVNGKCYVGQTTNVQARWKPGSYGFCRRFKRAIAKYGWDNFDHIILLQKDMDKEEMDYCEQAWISVLKTTDPKYGYNITAGGGGCLGFPCPKSEETKKKIGDANRGKPKPPRTEEHLRKASIAKTKWWGVHRDFRHTEESKEKTRQSMLGKKMPKRSKEWCEQRREISTKLMNRVIRNPDGTIKGFTSEPNPRARQPEQGTNGE
jgi:group I intron endonuclease